MGWIRGGQWKRSRGEWGVGSREQRRAVGECSTTTDGRETAWPVNEHQFGNGMVNVTHHHASQLFLNSTKLSLKTIQKRLTRMKFASSEHPQALPFGLPDVEIGGGRRLSYLEGREAGVGYTMTRELWWEWH